MDTKQDTFILNVAWRTRKVNSIEEKISIYRDHYNLPTSITGFLYSDLKMLESKNGEIIKAKRSVNKVISTADIVNKIDQFKRFRYEVLISQEYLRSIYDIDNDACFDKLMIIEFEEGPKQRYSFSISFGETIYVRDIKDNPTTKLIIIENIEKE